MLLSGLDKEVEKCKTELEKTHNCIILLSDNGIMDVLYLLSNEHKQLTISMKNKCSMMIDMRKAFKK